MAVMGNYCKAYPVARFREFPAWSERPAPPAPPDPPATEASDAAEEGPIEPYYFLQENFVVTRDIFMDEEIVFDQITPEWVAFCKEGLGFEVPEYARELETPEAAASPA